MTHITAQHQTVAEAPCPLAPALRLGVIGAGWIGRFHAESIRERVPGAHLAAVVDVDAGAAGRVAAASGAAAFTDPYEALRTADLDGVVISSPAATHTGLVVAAAEAGVPVFVEKPMATTLEDADRATAAADRAGIPLQVGFNRRFATGFREAGEHIHDGRIGKVQLMRSLTRDPELKNPERIRPGTIFLETLIHDFDTLNWFHPGARAHEVHVMADALIAPAHKDAGLLDTAVVTIRYEDGAIGIAEASFQAAYGYDIRGEAFGSGGMVTAGEVRTSSARLYGASGQQAETTRQNIDLFRQAYTDELIAFTRSIRGEAPDVPTGRDARAALAIALASLRSAASGQTEAVESEAAPHDAAPGGDRP
ncbi:Gfo/Idh/MocA family oxidoreductase [Nesterenkonia sp. K-15-9-6]|uniref:Gfo/Idh/MocA family oxidoreductase n=1 Tax=Nesterenkonia sp. K-15-9-6 TaxID=3093918 RepID=UPI0040446421